MLKRIVLQNQGEIEPSEFLLKTYDGVDLFVQCRVPYFNPKALIILIHSLGEHSNRYQQWIKQLVSKDFAVLCFDLRNHGRSGGKHRFSLNYSDMLKDVGAVILKGSQMFPHIPVFLYGHGFGGNLALNYATSDTTSINGLIITSPWLDPIKKIPWYQSVFLPYLIHIIPRMPVTTQLKAEDISRDLRAVHTYKNDPMVFNKIGIKLLYQINAASIKASRSIYKINVPFLLMHGNADNFISCQVSRNFVQNASDRTTFIEWDGAYYELHNDIDKENVMDATAKWLNIHC
jgi:acylglycerol lipase